MADVETLKLFVVGESSGNPDAWGDYKGFSLVLAHTLEEARSFADWDEVSEVEFDRPKLICHVPGRGDRRMQ